MAALATSPAVVLQDLPVRRIDDDDEGEESTILTLSAGKKLVMDCWTTRCERCPAALAKLNDFAAEYEKADDVLFLSVCLDDEDFGKELVEEWCVGCVSRVSARTPARLIYLVSLSSPALSLQSPFITHLFACLTCSTYRTGSART